MVVPGASDGIGILLSKSDCRNVTGASIASGLFRSLDSYDMPSIYIWVGWAVVVSIKTLALFGFFSDAPATLNRLSARSI